MFLNGMILLFMLLFPPILLIIFFPNSDKLISTILIFTLFVVGFIARPVGGAVFAYIADQYGRKKAFTLTVLFTASPALLIALLPTYSTIGKAAALLLLAFVYCKDLQWEVNTRF
jgi:MHS family proline/betaine transporter-like MFS transporter